MKERLADADAGDVRVLLWDIDGTLMRSSQREAFKGYSVRVLESVFGTAGRLAEMSVSGMTDWQIVLEALSDAGFTNAQIDERLGQLRARYVAELKRLTREAGEPMFQLLPGVREILEATDAHPRYRSALLTGNVRPAARLKLRATGLSRFFRLPGAFGDDSHDRRDLPAIAAARIQSRLRLKLDPSQFIVIGDTPNDIACARHFGARAIAVCTGRINNADTLRPHNPDRLLPDLSDTALVLRTLDEL